MDNNKIIETQSIEEVKPVDHYYGCIKNISNGNDISFLNRGSVYYLMDKIHKNNNSTSDIPVKHPYIILQSTYLDKIGRITVFSISSVPACINMIPIIMKGTIGYIDPHHPYTYKIADFFNSERSSYIGTITNPDVLDLLGNMYGMHLGLNLTKSNDEIINDYMKYVNEFNSRAVGVSRYTRKVVDKYPSNDQLDLQISFTHKYTEDNKSYSNDSSDEMMDLNEVIDDDFDDESISTSDNSDNEFIDTDLNIEEISTVNVPVKKKNLKSNQVKINKAIRLYNNSDYSVATISKMTGISANTIYNAIRKNKNITLRTEKNTINIDSTNQSLLSVIEMMESSPVDTIKFLDNKVSKMSEDEISILFLYVHLNSVEEAALLYNCSVSTIKYRMK